MKVINKVIIRLDAGNKYGLGHLSRCISIINEIDALDYLFVIKSDNHEMVKNFLNFNFNKNYSIDFLDENCTNIFEIERLVNLYDKNNLLIIDHYSADENYQLSLFKSKIEWLQLDSHAKINFYARWVMHGSPGATHEVYEKLKKNEKTEFLIGPEYCIIKDDILNLKKYRRPRKNLNKVIICFGGGDDRDATITCLESIDFSLLNDIKFYVSISPYNVNFEKIKQFENKGLIEIIKRDELHLRMSESDLALVAPGMISYESAFLGLPMILVTIADNQLINSIAWENKGCAVNIGTVKDVPNKLNLYLNVLFNNPNKLELMSSNCLKLVDGKGVSRIVKQITK
ncbi:hypothetical protein OBK03_06220 [Empedobacter falsenii]